MRHKFLLYKSVLALFALLSFNSAICVAQKVKSNIYFVVAGNDTTYCKNIIYYTTSQGYLSHLYYNDMEGKGHKLEGKKKVPDVITFELDTATIDKIPLKVNKPDGYVRYQGRVVDGRVRFYIRAPKTVQTTNGYQTMGSYAYYIRLPDGSFYDVLDKSDLNDIVKPFLMKCKAFAQQYKGNFSTEEFPTNLRNDTSKGENSFITMLKLYNSLCSAE